MGSRPTHEGEQEADDDVAGDSVCPAPRLPGGAREACRVGGNEGRDEVLLRLSEHAGVCRLGLAKDLRVAPVSAVPPVRRNRQGAWRPTPGAWVTLVALAAEPAG